MHHFALAQTQKTHKIPSKDLIRYEWGTRRSVCDRLGIGKTKLLEIRSSFWLEGFEFVRENDTSVSYNLTLAMHWWVFRHEPQLHILARERYAAQLQELRKNPS